MKNVVWGGLLALSGLSVVAPASAQSQDPFLLPASTISCKLDVSGTYTCVSHAKPLTLENVTASVVEAGRIHEVLQANGLEAVIHIKGARVAKTTTTKSSTRKTPASASVVHVAKRARTTKK